MGKFDSELMRVLMKRLPNRLDYVVSHRIEGAVELREITTGHDRVVIIIDCETDAKAIAPILDAIVRFIKRDDYFRLSYYSVFLWRRQHFEKIDAYDNVSGSWENFKEIYKPHKNAGQTILITTARKVTQLREMRTIGANNLILLYPRDDESENRETIAGVPCVAY